jgi:hypothetical protein
VSSTHVPPPSRGGVLSTDSVRHDPAIRDYSHAWLVTSVIPRLRPRGPSHSTSPSTLQLLRSRCTPASQARHPVYHYHSGPRTRRQPAAMCLCGRSRRVTRRNRFAVPGVLGRPPLEPDRNHRRPRRSWRSGHPLA